MDAEEWHGLAVDLTTVLEKRNAEIANLRAAARQDAEEKARLKGALAGARKDLAPIHMCDVISRDCAICKAVLRIDAALACRPQAITTKFDEVRCLKDTCEWPECECPRKDYPTGTFACPICQKDTPHNHSDGVVRVHRAHQEAMAAHEKDHEDRWLNGKMCGLATAMDALRGDLACRPQGEE